MSIPLDYSAQKRPPRRFSWRLIIILVLLLLAIPVGFVGYIFYGVWEGERMIRAKERLLLYKTDPQKMQNACMQVWQNRKSYRPWAGVKTSEEFPTPDPTDPAIPAIIRNLQPGWIGVTSDSVHIELGGGFYHYGLTAYLNGNQGAGTKQLIPGLWYDSETNEIPTP